MGRQKLLFTVVLGGFMALVGLWEYRLQASTKVMSQTQASTRGWVSRMLVWLTVDVPWPEAPPVWRDLRVSLRDEKGREMTYNDFVVALQKRGKGAGVLHLLPVGDFRNRIPRYAEVAFQGKVTVFRLEPVPPVTGQLSGRQVVLRDALLRPDTAVLFTCFSLPDPRDWRPQVRLETSRKPWVLFYEHLYQVQEAPQQRDRCFIFLFVSPGEAVTEPSTTWTLSTSSLILDRQQCLADEEKRRLESWAATQGPLLISLVYWQDAPASWPYRWCPVPPSEGGAMVASNVLTRWERAYETLFTHPVGADITFTLFLASDNE